MAQALPVPTSNARIRVHNHLVDAVKTNISLGEQRMLFYICAFLISEKDDELSVPYTIPVAHFIKVFQIKDKNVYRYLDEISENLTSRKIRVVDEEGEVVDRLVWAYRARYRKREGMLDVYFPPEMKPYLIGLKSFFTQIGFEDVSHFKSKHTVWIALFAIKNRKLGRRRIDYHSFRQQVAVDDGKYGRFRDFRRYVLDRGIEELKKMGSCDFTYRPVRSGNTVSHIDFTFQPYRPVRSGVSSSQLAHSVAVEMSSHGIAYEAFAGESLDFLVFCLELFKRRTNENLRKGKHIGKPDRYFRSLVEGNRSCWKPAKAVQGGEQPKPSRSKSPSSNRHERVRRRQIVSAYLKQVSEARRQELEADFEQSITSERLKYLWKQKGPHSPETELQWANFVFPKIKCPDRFLT